MRMILPIIVLLTAASCSAQETLTEGMPHVQFLEAMKRLNSTDITGGMEVVGAKGEWPLKGIYWELKAYGIVISVAFKDDKLTALTYWTEADFNRSKVSRAEHEKKIKKLDFNPVTKKIVASP